MSSAVVRQLILKDLYFARWMIAGAVLAGFAAIAMMPAGPVAAYVGGISLICVLTVLNIFLVMGHVVQERKDRTALFVLSLPISAAQYMSAKAVANALAFLVPWTVLTAVTLLVFDRTAVPNGMLPFWFAILVYLLAYYCVLLAVAIVTASTGWLAATITTGNVSINFLIPYLLARPSVVAHGEGTVAVWSADIG